MFLDISTDLFWKLKTQYLKKTWRQYRVLFFNFIVDEIQEVWTKNILIIVFADMLPNFMVSDWLCHKCEPQ